MNKIAWTGDRFECSNPELEDAKFEALRGNNKRLHEFMAACDLPMNGYSYDANWNIEIHRKTEQGGLVFFPIADEGTGFNICFHLGAYAIASMNLGQKLEICAYSFKSLLHPVLFQGLSKYFGDRPAQEIDKNCPYYSGDSTLKCAVNPSLPCKDCSGVSVGFNENLFVWLDQPLPDWKTKAHLAIEGLRRLAHPSVISVDLGTGQDATAIVTVFTNPDGSARAESLGIHANASEEDIEMARLRAYDRNFREAYQEGLSDRVIPLPPQIGGMNGSRPRSLQETRFGFSMAE